MAAVRTAQVVDRTANVRELTFREVRDWLLAIETGEAAPIAYSLAFEDCGLADLANMCDLSLADLEATAPSDLTELKQVAKELNPHFFRVRAALAKVARQMEAEMETLAAAQHSTEPLVFLSSVGTPASGITPGAPS